MALKLYFHPLSSFCQKALVAFYENATPFEPHIVDLADAVSRAAFEKMWPIGKMPVLRDDAQDRTIPEASIIIEYLALHYPGQTQLVPAGGGMVFDTHFSENGLYPFVSHSFASVDMGQVGLVNVGNVAGTMSH